jgi:hypothetical protein
VPKPNNQIDSSQPFIPVPAEETNAVKDNENKWKTPVEEINLNIIKNITTPTKIIKKPNNDQTQPKLVNDIEKDTNNNIGNTTNLKFPSSNTTGSFSNTFDTTTSATTPKISYIGNKTNNSNYKTNNNPSKSKPTTTTTNNTQQNNNGNNNNNDNNKQPKSQILPGAGVFAGLAGTTVGALSLSNVIKGIPTGGKVGILAGSVVILVISGTIMISNHSDNKKLKNNNTFNLGNTKEAQRGNVLC